MEKLTTIQKRANLNEVYRLGDIGPGGAFHSYMIVSTEVQTILEHIQFQNGPRMVLGSQEGVCDQDLLEIVRDRLTSFQQGPYHCKENAEALMHINEALLALNRRVEDRLERGVLGTMEK